MTSTRRKHEYINELPSHVCEITYYDNTYNSLFDRYWWDSINNRLIMKDKRSKKYKIVQPMMKLDKSRFVQMYDINNNQIYVNYHYLKDSYSFGHYLHHMIP